MRAPSKVAALTVPENTPPAAQIEPATVTSPLKYPEEVDTRIPAKLTAIVGLPDAPSALVITTPSPAVSVLP